MSAPPDPVVVARELQATSKKALAHRRTLVDLLDDVALGKGSETDWQYLDAVKQAPLLAGAVLSLTDENKALRELAERELGAAVADLDRPEPAYVADALGHIRAVLAALAALAVSQEKK